MGILAELVKKTREERGLSYKRVAEATGGDISNGYVWHIETETVKGADLTVKKLIALAKGLGLPAYEVVNAALRDALGGGAVSEAEPSNVRAPHPDRLSGRAEMVAVIKSNESETEDAKRTPSQVGVQRRSGSRANRGGK